MLKKLFITSLLSIALINSLTAQDHADHGHEAGEATHAEHAGGEEEKFSMDKMIMHHILDEHGWEFAHGFKLPLPVILYTPDRKLEVFSSAKLDDGQTYNGYQNQHEHIVRVDAAGNVDESVHPIDFSITKNVASMLLSAFLLIVIFVSVARGYKKNAGKAPSGIQSFFEPVITAIKDDVIKANIGPKYEKYLPYLLTLFFFILINNILGLTPGAANLTGNIAITLTLALFTFIIVHFSANKNYWMHIVAPPGVPGWLLPLFFIIEVIGVFMKPASLTIRLFANITGGHIIILSFIGLIFMFESFAVGGAVWLIGSFMTMIEILVAFIQAYIFTLLTSMYIGSAVEEHHAH